MIWISLCLCFCFAYYLQYSRFRNNLLLLCYALLFLSLGNNRGKNHLIEIIAIKFSNVTFLAVGGRIYESICQYLLWFCSLIQLINTKQILNDAITIKLSWDMFAMCRATVTTYLY